MRILYGPVYRQEDIMPTATYDLRDVALPASARAMTSLSRVDYTDSFRLELPRSEDRTAEEWARVVLEDAPAETRRMLRRGWLALGIRLGSTEDRRRVLGWSVRQSAPDYAVLGAHSLFGAEAELLLRREHGSLLFATIMKLNNPLVRAFWAAFSPQHRRVVRHLLRQAGRRA
jgi:hypothetical protein